MKMPGSFHNRHQSVFVFPGKGMEKLLPDPSISTVHVSAAWLEQGRETERRTDCQLPNYALFQLTSLKIN